MAESVDPELENDRTITRLNPDGIAISLVRQWPPYDRNGALYLSKGWFLRLDQSSLETLTSVIAPSESIGSHVLDSKGKDLD